MRAPLLLFSTLFLSALALAQGGDSKLTGKIEALPASSANYIGNWTVVGRTVQVTATTRLERQPTYAIGNCVEARGTMNGQVLVASRVDLKANACDGTSDDSPGGLELFGKVDQLPTTGLIGTWRVAGRSVVVTAATAVDQRRGPVAVNSCVQVKGTSNADNSVAATRIKVQSGTGGCGSGADDNDSYQTEFRGMLQANPPANYLGTWQVDGRSVVVNAQTKLEPNGRTLVAGDCISVGGTLKGDEVIAERIQGLGDGACKSMSPGAPSVVGLVTALPQGGTVGDWKIGTQTVRVNAQTRIDNEGGPIAAGTCVEARGTLQGDILTATRIERSNECGQGPAQYRLRGAVEAVPASGTLGDYKVAGRTVTATAQTTLNTTAGQLQLGACVEVLGQLQNSGTVLATSITVQSASGVCVAKGGVVDSASFDPLPVSAGQLISVFGRNIGPAVDLPVQLGQDNKVSSRLGNTIVRFDGVAAPILFASQGQLNVVVPCAVAGKTSTVMQIESNGAWSNTQTLPVVPASPSIFTESNSGKGPGAILNYDATTKLTAPNSPSNRAQRGSTIVIYATGLGATTPACTDGAITSTTNLPRPVLPVTVKIGGKDAVVEYAGLAPLLVQGVFQVNVKVPQDVEPGANVSVQLTAGGRNSQEGVTVAVR